MTASPRRWPNPVTAQPNRSTAMLFDLGVSSMQLDRAERGFAYAQDAPLDMRMDPESPLTAADIVNTYDEAALADILHRYGEERFARRIAEQIVRQRARTPFTSTAELVALLYQAIPAPARRTGGHPAKRTFQALRIAVNDELNSLRGALPAALDALTVGGRIVVLAYQSLEDRIVKRVFADAVASRTPVDLPVELPGHEPRFRSLTHGAERADAAEIERNPRSAAVRLRAVQRVTAGNREGRLMKAKRETPKRRGGTPSGRDDSAAGAGALRPIPAQSRRTRPGRDLGAHPREPRAQVRTANQPHRPAGRAVGPAQEHESGQGASQGAESQGAQGHSSSPDRTFGHPAGVDRPAAPDAGGQGSVCRVGHRCARRRTGPHAVVVHRLRRAFLPVEPRPREDPAAAAAEGGAGTRCARGGVRTGAGRGGPQAGHDPDAGTPRTWSRTRPGTGWSSARPSRPTAFRRRR